jgi:hypothetical protein
VQKATEPVTLCDLDIGVDRIWEWPEGAGVIQRPVRAVAVEM